jgi:hypothetical protein
VHITKFLKEHVIGIAIFALLTGVGGNYVYDYLKQRSSSAPTTVSTKPGPVSAERPLKIFLLIRTSDEALSSRSSKIGDVRREHEEPDFVVTSVHRVSIYHDPPGFEFELEGADKARYAEFTREHLGRVALLEWGKEPLATVRFATTSLDGCIGVSPAENWSMTEFFYLCRLYQLKEEQ